MPLHETNNEWETTIMNMDDAMVAAGFTCNLRGWGGNLTGVVAWKRAMPDCTDGYNVVAEDRGEDAPWDRRYGVLWRRADDTGEWAERWTVCGHDLPTLAASVAADPGAA
jgi:hypothetical protein